MLSQQAAERLFRCAGLGRAHEFLTQSVLQTSDLAASALRAASQSFVPRELRCDGEAGPSLWRVTQHEQVHGVDVIKARVA
jgi:hypothetical protein